MANRFVCIAIAVPMFFGQISLASSNLEVLSQSDIAISNEQESDAPVGFVYADSIFSRIGSAWANTPLGQEGIWIPVAVRELDPVEYIIESYLALYDGSAYTGVSTTAYWTSSYDMFLVAAQAPRPHAHCVGHDWASLFRCELSDDLIASLDSKKKDRLKTDDEKLVEQIKGQPIVPLSLGISAFRLLESDAVIPGLMSTSLDKKYPKAIQENVGPPPLLTYPKLPQIPSVFVPGPQTASVPEIDVRLALLIGFVGIAILSRRNAASLCGR